MRSGGARVGGGARRGGRDRGPHRRRGDRRGAGAARRSTACGSEGRGPRSSRDLRLWPRRRDHRLRHLRGGGAGRHPGLRDRRHRRSAPPRICGGTVGRVVRPDRALPQAGVRRLRRTESDPGLARHFRSPGGARRARARVRHVGAARVLHWVDRHPPGAPGRRRSLGGADAAHPLGRAAPALRGADLRAAAFAAPPRRGGARPFRRSDRGVPAEARRQGPDSLPAVPPRRREQRPHAPVEPRPAGEKCPDRRPDRGRSRSQADALSSRSRMASQSGVLGTLSMQIELQPRSSSSRSAA